MVRARVPTLEIERGLWRQGMRIVAGADEVGRGCLAGPVVAAACILLPDVRGLGAVRDSKMLTPRQRSRLVDLILDRAVAVGVGAASRREIDALNVRVATALAIRRALDRLGCWEHAIYDGPAMPELDPDRTTPVPQGDARSLSIACASVIAKVTRDRLMARLAERCPEYGWERNVGYGTGEHLEAIECYGPSPFHRRSFARVREHCDDEADLLAAREGLS